MTHRTNKFGRPIYHDPIREEEERERIKQEGIKWGKDINSRAEYVTTAINSILAGRSLPVIAQVFSNSISAAQLADKNRQSLAGGVRRARRAVLKKYFQNNARKPVLSFDIPQR